MPTPIRRIAILGNFPPRKCGIATFTADLSDAILSQTENLHIDVISVSDHQGYDYDGRVRYVIDQEDQSAYKEIGQRLRHSNYDVLLVQHEYGIFGGESGAFVLDLLRATTIPIITTLHTVLREPSATQRTVMDSVLRLSTKVVVMSQLGAEILQEVHGYAAERILLIPHGVPDIPPSAGIDIRRNLGLTGPMMLTFGLLSPDKGIENVIRAMPNILKECPNTKYFVVGATHPNVKAHHGEVYRESLTALTEELGVQEAVVFVNEFLPISGLIDHLGAMDYYVTPYLNPHQITSGTLAYAMAAGKVAISSPYLYAKEVLDQGRGVLVPFRGHDEIAEAIIRLEQNSDERKAIGLRAAEYGESMRWPNVGEAYLKVIRQVSTPALKVVTRNIPEQVALSPLQTVQVDHLIRMSDDTGMFQHATFSTPNRKEGYCVDDNARALICTLYLENLGDESLHLPAMQSRYLSFVHHAYNHETKRFRNFMSYSRNWLECFGSEDSQGRSLWALGTCAGRSSDENMAALAGDLFRDAATGLESAQSPRTWAYAILGCAEYLRAHPDQFWVHDFMADMAERLAVVHKAHASEDWNWFEPVVSYANARLSQCLIVAGRCLNDDKSTTMGMETLEWLMNVQTSPRGHLAPVGSNGFYRQDAAMARFDQQPLEVWASVSACLEAYNASGSRSWLSEAERAFAWFDGENDLGLRLYDPRTGGCRDGLHRDRVNQNQGAESTLSYLCSLCELKSARQGLTGLGEVDRNELVL